MALADSPLGHLDDYELRHLAAHLRDAGRGPDLHRLLRLEYGATSVNAWWEAKEAAGDGRGYLDDLALAWQLASECSSAEIGAGGRPDMGLELEYAVMAASQRTLTAAVPSALRVAAVREGVWSATQAIGDARQVVDVDARASALLDLVPYLPERQRSEVLDEVLAIVRVRGGRAGRLAAVAGHLAGSERDEVVAEALEYARSIPGDGRGSALVEVAEVADDDREALLWEALEAGGLAAVAARADELSAALASDALARARAIPGETGRGRILADLAAAFPEPERDAVAAEALTAAERLGGDERLWVEVNLAARLGRPSTTLFRAVHDHKPRWLPAVIERLGPVCESLDHLRELVRAIEDPRVRVRSLAALVPWLSTPAREAVLRELFGMLGDLPFQSWREEAVDRVAPHLSAPRVQAALKVARTGDDRAAVLRNVARLAPYLSTATAAEVLGHVRPLTDVAARGEATAFLSTRLPDPEHRTCWAEAMADAPGWFTTAGWWIDGLESLATMVVESERSDLWAHALPALQANPVPWHAAQLIVRLTPFLPSDVLRESQARILEAAIAEAVRGSDYGDFLSPLQILAPTLDEELAAPVLQWVRTTIDVDDARAEALTCLASRLEGPIRAQVLAEAVAAFDRRVVDPARWRPALQLAALLPELEGTELVTAVVAVAGEVQSHEQRVRLLAEAARLSPEPAAAVLREQALALARDIQSPWGLAAVAETLPEPGRETLLGERMRAACAVRPNSTPRKDALRSIARDLAAAPSSDGHPLVQQALSTLALNARETLVADMAILAPALAQVTAVGTLDAFAVGAMRALSWWP